MNISFIGAGNVAWHLSQALENADYRVSEVYSRQVTHARALVEQLYDAKVHRSLDFSFSKSKLFFLCVPDDAMDEVVSKLTLPVNSILVHTSGSRSLTYLQDLAQLYLDESIKIGVFYPIQTFSKTFHVDFSKIPICLESSDLDVENLLISVAQRLSDITYAVNSEERKVLHLAAVFACNFANHLWGIAQEIMQKNDLEFSLLKPLMQETLRKALEADNVFEVQTGPARRNDQSIIMEHLAMLRQEPDFHQIYQNLTHSIIETHTL